MCRSMIWFRPMLVVSLHPSLSTGQSTALFPLVAVEKQQKNNKTLMETMRKIAKSQTTQGEGPSGFPV